MTWSEGNRSEHRVRIVAQQKKCRQSDRRRGVASGGLGDDLLRRKLRQLAQMMAGRRSSLVMIQKRLGRSHGRQARDRLLDHGLLAVEREQLLGATLAAQRPETRAPAAGQDHGIEMRIRLHRTRSLSFCAAEKLNHRDAEVHETRASATFRSAWRARALSAPGTLAFRNSTVHCGRTLNSPTARRESRPHRPWQASPDRDPAPQRLRSLRRPPEFAPKFSRLVLDSR